MRLLVAGAGLVRMLLHTATVCSGCARGTGVPHDPCRTKSTYTHTHTPDHTPPLDNIYINRQLRKKRISLTNSQSTRKSKFLTATYAHCLSPTVYHPFTLSTANFTPVISSNAPAQQTNVKVSQQIALVVEKEQNEWALRNKKRSERKKRQETNLPAKSSWWQCLDLF